MFLARPSRAKPRNLLMHLQVKRAEALQCIGLSIAQSKLQNSSKGNGQVPTPTSSLNSEMHAWLLPRVDDCLSAKRPPRIREKSEPEHSDGLQANSDL